MSEEFYIRDTRTVVGNACLWWRPNRCGYTTNLDEAGKYSREDALVIEALRGTDVAVRVDVARACCVLIVDYERLLQRLAT